MNQLFSRSPFSKHLFPVLRGTSKGMHAFHRMTKPNHPWTNGQFESMNRTITEATVQRYHYDSHCQLQTHLSDFVAAYNFARRLKTLNGLTPYKFICHLWQKKPRKFTLDTIIIDRTIHLYIRYRKK